MYVPATLVPELLLARAPEAEPRGLSHPEPHAVILPRERLEPEGIAVEALEPPWIAGPEGELCEGIDHLCPPPDRSGRGRRGDRLARPLESQPQPALCRAQRHAGRLGDLRGRKAPAVGHQNGVPLCGR